MSYLEGRDIIQWIDNRRLSSGGVVGETASISSGINRGETLANSVVYLCCGNTVGIDHC